jgi:hypothetical protein
MFENAAQILYVIILILFRLICILFYNNECNVEKIRYLLTYPKI